MPIRLLPATVAAAIAAGEVIERPASIVKELVENALDAGATAVSVEIERGGLGLIRVVDNGRGMSAADLALAVHRHATSKLTSVDDLRRIATLGFRGEGLPSIAAAADLLVRTREPDAESGVSLEVVNGVPGSVRPAAAAPGTSVMVTGLFERQPARRAFLRSLASEAAQISTLITHFALAYPDVRFTLTVDQRRRIETPGSGDLREAAAHVYGVAVAGRLLAFAGSCDAVQVSGLLSPPELSRPSRAGITLFVNGRAIRNARLTYAVESGYDTLLAGRRYPIAIIDLRVPPHDVEVNVHPAKSEVRFRDERAAFGALQAAVRKTVAGTAPVPQFDVGSDIDTTSLDGDAAVMPDLWSTAAPPDGLEHAQAPLKPLLPVLRVVGQVGTTYIIAEGPDGMFLIDQHAAHERVLYEQIVAQRNATSPQVQGLLAPVLVEVTAPQSAAFAGAADELAGLGYDVEPFGPGVLAVRAVPSLVADRDVGAGVCELLDAIASEDVTPAADRTTLTLACHAAVRAGMHLSLDEMRTLVRSLEQCASPRTCPHGRPTMMHLSAALLDRGFRRGR